MALLVIIPIQLNKYFFVDASYVLGVPIDYRALTVYLSDIVLLGFLVTTLSKNIQKVRQVFLKEKKLTISLLLFISYIFVNNLTKPGFPIPTYFSLKIALLGLFLICARLSLQDKKTSQRSAFVILISLLWQSALIISQFLTQHSQNLLFLGERSFDSGTTNIAHINLFGLQLLRGYGTFPHPNVAGAFIAIYLMILDITGNHIRERKVYYFIRAIALFALALTFSRAAIIIYFCYLILVSKNLKFLILKAAAFSLALLFLSAQLINSQISSIAERITLVSASIDIIKKFPLFGVGNTNFLTYLAALNLSSLAQTRLIQPVHDLFLLITAENGIVGLVLFAAFLFQAASFIKNKRSLLLFSSLLVFATVDHFLWTLQQGQLLFWLSLAVVSTVGLNKSQPS